MSKVRVSRRAHEQLLSALRDQVEDLGVLARALGPFFWDEEEWITAVSLQLKDLTGRSLFGDGGWLEEPEMRPADHEYNLIGFMRDRFEERLSEIERALSALLWPQAGKVASMTSPLVNERDVAERGAAAGVPRSGISRRSMAV